MKKSCALLTLTLLFAACSKRVSTVSPSATGQNIVAFTVNGQQHVYGGFSSWNTPAGIQFGFMQITDSTRLIQLSASGIARYRDELGISGNSYMTSKPAVNISYPVRGYYMVRDAQYQDDMYVADTTVSSITFTRYDDNVAAGTFKFTGTWQAQTITLTDGFFDVALK